MRRIYREGSYTVEAAFIIPLIFLIVFATMALAFHLHDQVVLVAWEEECLSQARMAVLYEKVPYDDTISWISFSEDDYDYIEGAALDNNYDEKNIFFVGKLSDADLSFSGNLIELDGHFKESSPFLARYYKENEEIYFEANRDSTSSITSARYTTLVYRLIKTIFKG